MAKVTKGALKAIVKECLLEILVEGLAGQDELALTESRAPIRQKSKRPRVSQRSRPALDSVSFNNNVDRSVSGLTDDPMMASLLSDTARTTLQEQLNDPGSRVPHSAQVNTHGDTAQKIVASQDPTDLFGDASMNWEALAFSGAGNKK